MFKVKDDVLVVEFVVTREDGEVESHFFGADMVAYGPVRKIKIHPDGSYFSMVLGEEILHGDAWALASWMSGASASISPQEIMYIGQGYGDGSSNAWTRTTNHKKLQMIHEDHAGEFWDIFVSPLRLKRRAWNNDDHIDDAEPGPKLENYYENFARLEGGVLKPSVDLIEHCLISYFKPYYNEKLKEWDSGSPTSAMLKARASGFRLVHVHLDGWHGLSRLYSKVQPELHRSHFISREIVRASDVSSTRLDSSSGIAARALAIGPKMFPKLAEDSDVYFRVFGDQSPEIRRPPAFDPRVSRAPIGHRVYEVEEGKEEVLDHAAKKVYEAIISQREEFGKENLFPSDHPTYDASSGLISIGVEVNSGGFAGWKLNSTRGRGVLSGLICGEEGGGKSNALRVIMFEAIRSGCFVVFPADCRGGQGYREMLKGFVSEENWIATNEEEAFSHLARASSIIAERSKHTGYNFPSRDKPGILFCLDDSDEILKSRLGSQLVEEILTEGPQAGVGLVLVVRDIRSPVHHPSLMSKLMKLRNKLIYTTNFDTYYTMRELEVRHSERRRVTYNSKLVPTLITESRSDCLSVGILASTTHASMPINEAKAWANSFLEKQGLESIEWEKSGTAWSGVGVFSLSQWEIRKHPDSWALVYLISRKTGIFDHAMSEALRWAEDAIRDRFDVVMGEWEMGPGSPGEKTLAIYSNPLGPMVPRDQPDKTELLIMHTY